MAPFAGPASGRPGLLVTAWGRRGSGPVGAARLIRLVAGHLRELRGILGAARRDADALLLAGISCADGYHIALALGVPSIGLALHSQTGGFHDRGSLRPLSGP